MPARPTAARRTSPSAGPLRGRRLFIGRARLTGLILLTAALLGCGGGSVYGRSGAGGGVGGSVPAVVWAAPGPHGGDAPPELR